MRAKLKDAKLIVVKIGTSVLADDGRIDSGRIAHLVDQVAMIWQHKRDVVLVTSGAIGCGMSLLGMRERPKTLRELQAAAAVGQAHLMQLYNEAFKNYSRQAAQILLTREDVRAPRRFRNARHTLDELIRRGIVPIINENDTVATEEISLGDNDMLSALLAVQIKADALVILTDVEGLYKGEELIPYVRHITPALKRLACGTRKAVCRGGMDTKLDAAAYVLKHGISCVVANGRTRDCLLRILAGEEMGTAFGARA